MRNSKFVSEVKGVDYLLVMAILMVAMTGCIEMKPIPMDTLVGTLPAVEKIPLKAALVTPDPPTHRVMYTPPSMTGRKEPVDQTEQMNESMWPLGRELAKASRDAFSQVFDQIASLRQLPLPGEYDLVIQPKISVVRMEGYMESFLLSVNAWQDLSCDWTMAVLDNKGIPILSRQGTTPKKRIVVKPSFSTEGHMNTMGVESSELLVSLVKEWVFMLAVSPEIRDYVRQMQKP